MNKVAGIIIGVVAAAFVGLVTYSLIDKNSHKIDYSGYDANTVIDANEQNGQIADHIMGGGADAPVIIYEYADYQCPGCASTNPFVQKLLEKYGDKVGIVYRSYLLSYHQNGRAAAAAAEAAGLQGFWQEYHDLLFANQSEWEYASGTDRTDLFVKYFEQASDGTGDVAKFKSDMASDAVDAKINFDIAMGEAVKIPGTPAFYLDGEWLDWSKNNTESKWIDFFSEKIDAKLAQ